MKKFIRLLQITLVALAFLSAAHYYNRLPATIPIHWNIHGEADGFGPKWLVFALPTIMLLLQVLLSMIGNSVAEEPNATQATAIIVTSVLALTAMIHGTVIGISLGFHIDIIRVICGGVALLNMVMGSQIALIPRNTWIGIRTPWTLASDHVWIETHRRAAKSMTRAGLIGAALTATPWPWIGIIVAIGGTLYPAYDSWRINVAAKR